MTALAETGTATALRRAAVRATLAPSVRNTQPWRLHLREGRLDIRGDRGRQVRVLDPIARQLVVSVGCAVFNGRVGLAGLGVGVDVHRHPDPAQPDLQASLVPTERPAEPGLAALDHVVELRHTNRGRFADEPVPAPVIESLEAAAEAERASLFAVRGPEQQRTVARLSRQAENVANLNPAYRAELRAWATEDPAGIGGAPGPTGPHLADASLPDRCLLLVCTEGDRPADWLRAGEALERVLLEIAGQGFAATPLCQIIEVPSARAQLRRDLGLTGDPQVLLRVGRAPATPASRRRHLVDLLVEETY